MDEAKLVNQTLIECLGGTTEQQRLALDALTDFLRIFAREGHYPLPYHCPIVRNEALIAILEGVPLYFSDLRKDADIRETIKRRVMLYNTKEPNYQPAVVPGAMYPDCIDDVFVTARFTDYATILAELSGVGPWHHTGGHGAPKADTVINFRLFHQAAQRDFYADVSLSDDRKTLKVEFR